MGNEHYPVLTVGIVVWNRDWIIGKMLNSLLSQKYPHNKIFVVVVDGESKDKTVEIARNILERSNFLGFKIITKKCSIPEGRNICIENMKGEMLLFWDSDVIMESGSLYELVRTIIQDNADIVTANGIFLSIKSIEELDEKIMDKSSLPSSFEKNYLVEVSATAMGYTMIKKEVFAKIFFDPDFTVIEDLDFGLRAKKEGFRIFENLRVKAYDINLRKKAYSDIYIDMPFNRYFKGLNKKSKVIVASWLYNKSSNKIVNFFLWRKRYLFYLGYLPILFLTIYGIIQNIIFFSYLFPLYTIPFILYQIYIRGIKRGLVAVIRSILIGIPFSLFLVYYFIKYTLVEHQRTRMDNKQ